MKSMRTYYIALIALLLMSCGKGFLEKQRDRATVVPKAVKDFQAMLDNATYTVNAYSSHELGVIGADEFYLSDGVWNSFQSREWLYQKNAYIWSKNSLYEEDTQVSDWNRAYNRILNVNIVLDGIEKITPGSQDNENWNNVKGSALFLRSFNFYQLAQLFCQPYTDGKAASELGLPLRLQPDVIEKVSRSDLETTYQVIICDLKEAAALLPISPLVYHRPSKPACFALLARVYLNMGNYPESLKYAERCLQLKDDLFDFNNLDLTRETYYTFDIFQNNHPEILFLSNMGDIPIASFGTFNADTLLYSSYKAHDLRKSAFFWRYSNTIMFKGGYGASGFFSGLATDEVLLIRAECNARMGNDADALAELNKLLENRYEEGYFVPYTIDNPQQVLDLIIEERKKELLLRGVRWEDLRRLNKEGRYAKTLIREINGQQYVLEPGDLRYTWPLPPNVIRLGGLEQNPR